MAIETAERTIQDALDQFENPKHSSTTCTAGTSVKAFYGSFLCILTPILVDKSDKHKEFTCQLSSANLKS